MALYQKRLEAIKLRKKGLSVGAIAKSLLVSKSTASLWCRNITLNDFQRKELKKNQILLGHRGRIIGAMKNKQKRLSAIKKADALGETLVKKITKRELLLIATALYWSEGSKSDRTSGFIFVNSDPEMVLIMKLFLVNILNISPKDIVCSIQINKIHEKRIRKVLSFWKNLLQLENSQFRKPYYVNTKANKVYANYENYYGICRLIVRRGMNLKYQMLGLIKAVKSDILSG